jgi:tetratricopeptide (TPR) repeat protein
MKLIRRILRYVMLLVFIVAIGCAYYYRSLIFSEIINTYVDGTVNRVLVWANIVPEQADPTTQETPEPQEAEGIQEVADCEIREAVAQATETKVIKCECEIEITNLELVAEAHVDEAANDEPVQTETEEQTPEAGAGLTPDTEPVPMVVEEQGFETDVDQAAEWEPVQTETEEQTIETEADQAIDEETEQEQTEEDSGFEVASESNSTNSHSELINQARLLHLTGNSNNAIELYRELAELYPDDPNVVGEMGNVYYLQGDWEQASLAYYEAALRLQKLRMTEQIHYLYLVIHGLDPDVAEKLREQLES